MYKRLRTVRVGRSEYPLLLLVLVSVLIFVAVYDGERAAGTARDGHNVYELNWEI